MENANPKYSARAVGEVIAVIGVILSLIYVGLEFRQSTIASRAAAYQELGIATADVLFRLSENPDLAIAVRQATIDPSALTLEERLTVLNWLMGTLRLYETVFLQVKLELLEPESLDYLGWRGYRQLGALKNLWPEISQSLETDFVEFIESSWQ